MLLEHFDRCCSQAESLEDGCDVGQVTQDRAFFNDRRNDDRIARQKGDVVKVVIREERALSKVGVLVAHNGSVGAQDELATAIGISVGTAGKVEIVLDALALLVDEGVRVIDLALDGDARRHLGNHEPVAVFKWKVGKGGDVVCVGLKLEDDATGRLSLAQTRQSGARLSSRFLGCRGVPVGECR